MKLSNFIKYSRNDFNFWKLINYIVLINMQKLHYSYSRNFEYISSYCSFFRKFMEYV